MLKYPLGINGTNYSFEQTVWVSPDVMATANNPMFTLAQTTLAQDYKSGSGVFQFNNPDNFRNGLINGNFNYFQGFLSTTGNYQRTVYGTFIVGTPNFQVTNWYGNQTQNDVDYPSGTLFTYTNANMVQLNNSNSANWYYNPEYLENGRRTGYPSGMFTGQTLSPQFEINQGSWGYYTLMADGDGSLSVKVNSPGAVISNTYNVTVTSGNCSPQQIYIPSGYYVPTFNILTSSFTNPIRNIRFICPDVNGGTSGNFVAQYQANRNNPYFFLWHPDYITSLKPFSLIRFMDLLNTNAVFQEEWTDIPDYNGVNPGINFQSVPYQWLADLANTAQIDSWWNVPHTASDDYVSSMAAFLRDNIDPSLKICIEYSNEVWNSIFNQFSYSRLRGVGVYNPAAVQSIAYTGGLVTVIMPNHGFSNSGFIQIDNCQDENYNGSHYITVVDSGTFTYRPILTPTNPTGVAKRHFSVLALDTASKWYAQVSGITWNGFGDIQYTTYTNNNLKGGDLIQLSNASDPGFNGIYYVNTVTSTTIGHSNLGLRACNLAIPQSSPGLVVNATAKSGQTMGMWRIAFGSSPSDVTLADAIASASEWYARRSAQIHKIFANTFGSGQQNRLVNIIGWQMAPYLSSSGWFNWILKNYRSEMGGTYLPESETALAVAPYFYTSLPNMRYFGSPKTISSIISSGYTAVVNLNNHGYSGGQYIQIGNINQSGYCGIYPITVVNSNQFTYTCENSGLANGSSNDTNISYGMFATNSYPYLREITTMTPSGTSLICRSVGHGIPNNTYMYFCSHNGSNGQFNIQSIDSDSFYINNSGVFTTGGGRIWAYTQDAIDSTITDVENNVQSVFSMMVPAQNTCISEGISLRCYESGQSLYGNSNPVFQDVSLQVNLSEDMGEIYKNYYECLYGIYGVKVANVYNHIANWGTFGFWGLKRHQHDSNTYKWISVMNMCDGVPDFNDGGGPDPTNKQSFNFPRSQFTSRR